MCGTPAYLAPEVVLNDGGYTALVDSWSLGVIVFAMYVYAVSLGMSLSNNFSCDLPIRLSATMPFVTNETQDLRTSLQQRVVMWEYLPSCVSELCEIIRSFHCYALIAITN